MKPYIVWCRQRTGSISLFNALKAVSEHRSAESEPFDGSVEPRQFSIVPTLSEKYRDAELKSVCMRRWNIKHVYDRLSLDFNLALVKQADDAGYGHIHLFRKNELARLVSLGVAENEAVWFKCAETEQAADDFLSGKRHLKPLDVPSLVERSRTADLQWVEIIKCLRSCFYVPTEDLYGREVGHKRGVLVCNLIGYLEIYDYAKQRELELELEKKNGQDTDKLRHLVPNVDELRQALLGG
jgi:hypothetical protein